VRGGAGSTQIICGLWCVCPSTRCDPRSTAIEHCSLRVHHAVVLTAPIKRLTKSNS
jgi:hypothetical protein